MKKINPSFCPFILNHGFFFAFALAVLRGGSSPSGGAAGSAGPALPGVRPGSWPWAAGWLQDPSLGSGGTSAVTGRAPGLAPASLGAESRGPHTAATSRLHRPAGVLGPADHAAGEGEAVSHLGGRQIWEGRK